MAAKTTPVIYFYYILFHDFWFLHDLELINLWSKWPIFDLQVQNGYRQHTNKSCFYARELWYHKQHLLKKNFKK